MVILVERWPNLPYDCIYITTCYCKVCAHERSLEGLQFSVNLLWVSNMIYSIKYTESFSVSFTLVVQVIKGVNFSGNHWNFSEIILTTVLYRLQNFSAVYENYFGSKIWVEIMSENHFRIKILFSTVSFWKLLRVSNLMCSMIYWLTISFYWLWESLLKNSLSLWDTT